MIHRTIIKELVNSRPGYSFFKWRFHGSPDTITLSLYDAFTCVWNEKEWFYLTERQFKAKMEELRKRIPAKDLEFLDGMVPRLEAASRGGSSIRSFKYYPQFRVLAYLGDGFPVARFVLSENFQEVYFAMIYPDKRNGTLMHSGNENSIPYIFPVNDFPKYINRIYV